MPSVETKIFIYLLLSLFVFGCGPSRHTSPEPVQADGYATELHGKTTHKKDITAMIEAVRIKLNSESRIWNRAATYWHNGDVERAAAEMKKYVRLDPGNPEAHNVIGLDYYCKGLYEAALYKFQKAAELNPDQQQYSYNEALALARLDRYEEAGQALERASGLKESQYLREVYAELISMNKAKKLYNEGCAAMEKSYSTHAIRLFKSALEIRPDMVEAHVNLGVLYGKKGDRQNQIYHLEEAAKLEPHAADIHYNLGLAYLDAGMYSQAIVELKQAVEIKPFHRYAHFKLGMALCKVDRYADATARFERCLEIFPHWFEAHINLGTCYLKIGNVDGAVIQFKKAIELRPGSAEAHYNLGEVHIKTEEFRKAADLLQKVLEIDSEHEKARRRLKELEKYIKEDSESEDAKIHS